MVSVKKEIVQSRYSFFSNLGIVSCTGAKCFFQVKSSTYLPGENIARCLLKSAQNLNIFINDISFQMCDCFIYPEKIIIQINAENFIEKSAVVFKT